MYTYLIAFCLDSCCSSTKSKKPPVEVCMYQYDLDINNIPVQLYLDERIYESPTQILLIIKLIKYFQAASYIFDRNSFTLNSRLFFIQNSNTNNKTLLLLLIPWCLASCGHYNVVSKVEPRRTLKYLKFTFMRLLLRKR